VQSHACTSGQLLQFISRDEPSPSYPVLLSVEVESSMSSKETREQRLEKLLSKAYDFLPYPNMVDGQYKKELQDLRDKVEEELDLS